MKSFTCLQNLLCDAVDRPLQVIDWTRPFNLYSDASDYCVAGALSQTDTNGKEMPIAFYSKKLNSTQRAWATIHKEAYAVLEGLRKFRHWIFGYNINVFSDHNPLKFVTESAPASAKLTRWTLALQEYDLSFHYKPGASDAMAVPDCLSRLGPE